MKKRPSKAFVIAGLLIGVLVVACILIMGLNARSGGGAPPPELATAGGSVGSDKADAEWSPAPVMETHQPTHNSNSVAVIGLVVDEDGDTLEGAVIQASAGDALLGVVLAAKPLAKTESMKDGGFSLAGLNPEVEYNFSAVLNGYITQRIEYDGRSYGSGFTATLPQGGASGVRIVMRRIGTIDGVVADPQGRPLEGVVVHAAYSIKTELQEPSWVFLEPTRQTGQDGQFHISGVPAESISLWASRFFGRGTQKKTIPAVYGSETAPLKVVALRPGESKAGVVVPLPLDVARQVEGRVIDAENKPLVGVDISLLEVERQYLVGATPDRTPSTGAFRISGIQDTIPTTLGPLPVEKMRLIATLDGYDPQIIEDITVGMKNINVVMNRSMFGRICCRLYDASTGSTIHNATVFLGSTEVADYDATRSKGSQPSFWGWATLENVPAGTVDLVIQADNYGFLVEEGVLVRPEKTTEVEIPLSQAGLLCVKILTSDKYKNSVLVGGSSLVSVIPMDVQKDSRSGYQCTRMLDTLKTASTSLRCDGKSLSPPSSHRDVELPPGQYKIEMRLVMGQVGEINDKSPLYELTSSREVEVSGGAVTSYVWNVAEDIADDMGKVTINLEDLAGEQCIISLKPSASEANRNDVLTRFKIADLLYLTGVSSSSVTIPAVPVGSYTVTLTTTERRAYRKPALGCLDIHVADGNHVVLSSHNFRPQEMPRQMAQ